MNDDNERQLLKQETSAWLDKNFGYMQVQYSNSFVALSRDGIEVTAPSSMVLAERADALARRTEELHGPDKIKPMRIYFVSPAKIYDAQDEAEAFQTAIRAARSPVEVDKIFDGLNALPAPLAAMLVDGLEATLANEWKKMTVVDRDLIRRSQYGTRISDISTEDKEQVKHLMADSQVYLNLHKFKGDDAHPLTKTWTAAAAGLPGWLYASGPGQLLLFYRVTVEMEAAGFWDARPAGSKRLRSAGPGYPKP
ncbi:MAG: hypothetical protein EPN97_04010 [Alphaproteobacteria bacterium]|nr:MAG: hypothetical protein EPN97_04010 [Alphaproteobacteria bacterium]